MLSQVDRAQRRGTDVVFLGWEPHPMNTRFKMKYLTGGDEFFAHQQLGIDQTQRRQPCSVQRMIDLARML